MAAAKRQLNFLTILVKFITHYLELLEVQTQS